MFAHRHGAPERGITVLDKFDEGHAGLLKDPPLGEPRRASDWSTSRRAQIAQLEAEVAELAGVGLQVAYTRLKGRLSHGSLDSQERPPEHG